MTDLVLGHDSSGNKIKISRNEQRRSLYVLGSTGTGKSTLFLNLIKQTIDQDIGLCLLDAHGDLTNQVISITPPHKHKDIILIDISNEEYCVGLNLYESPQLLTKKAVNDGVERIMHMWDKLFHITPTDFPQIREYMLHAAHTIVVNPGYTMADISRLFRDKDFRNTLLANVHNQSTKEFWLDYDALPNFERHNQLAAVRRRLSEFLTDMIIPIVGQATSTIDMRKIMDARPAKILLVKLDRNQESASSLIGSLIVSLIRTAGFSRDDMPQDKRKHFLLYSDEFQNFASPDFQSILTELRKYAVGTIMAHQDRHILDTQVPELVRSTLATNLVVFNINPIDSEEVKWRFDTTPPEPEIEEIGRLPILTYKKDIINHLAHVHDSANPVINDFFDKFLSKIIQVAAQAYSSDTVLDPFNDLFYRAMAYKEIYSDIIVEKVIFFTKIFVNGGVGNLDLYYPYTILQEKNKEFFNGKIRDYLMSGRARELLQEMTEGEKYSLWYEKTYKSEPNADNITSIESREGFQYLVKVWNDPDRGIAYKDAIIQLERLLKEFITVTGVYARVEKDYWAKESEIKVTLAVIEPSWQENERKYRESFYLFIEYFCMFRDFLVALAADPLYIESNRFEINKRIGPQLSSTEMAARTSNTLSGLPNFSAYTRIGGDIQYCWNCGNKANPLHYCRLCGKKLKPEYTITVTPPPFSAVDLKTVTRKITQQNLQDKYLRKRSEIDQEIANRQHPTPPPNPAPQPQKPAGGSPPPQKRKGAIGKVCSKCQANNAATSLFCSQCGNKL